MQPHHRVVILTGASQGIGRATAWMLAEAGCKLVLAARGQVCLQLLADTLTTSGHEAIAIPTDMGNTAQAAALAQKTVEAFGRVDIVINNAAIAVRDRVADLNEAEARRVMEVNYFGPVALIQAAIPYLKANAEGGLIINISSIVGRRAMPGLAGYCASKSALERMAESLRVELTAANIRVSTVYPGVTATNFRANSLGRGQGALERMRGVAPERVARAILKTIRNEPRDVFITLPDRLFITAGMLLPGLIDKVLSRYELI